MWKYNKRKEKMLFESIKDTNWNEITTQSGNIEIYTFWGKENKKWKIKK